MSVAVLYSYYEKNEMYKENLKHFLRYGLIQGIDTFIISNGPITVTIPPIQDNKNIILLTRENIGADFGAWNYGLKYIKNEHRTKAYDYYFFINTSVRGPFLPKYYKGTWLNAYMELFRTSQDVHLVGATICVMHADHEFTPIVKSLSKIYGFTRNPPYTHVQSMFFGMTRESLEYIWNIGLFNYSGKTLIDIVINQEILLSTLILDRGWNINCMLNTFRDVDYREINTSCDVLGCHGDLWFNNVYFGKNIHPYEVIFYKNNRIPLIEYDVFTNAKFRIYESIYPERDTTLTANMVACGERGFMSTSIPVSEDYHSITSNKKSWSAIVSKYIPDFVYDIMDKDGKLPPIAVNSEAFVCQLSHDFFYKFHIRTLRMAFESGEETLVFRRPTEIVMQETRGGPRTVLEEGEATHKGFINAWTNFLDKIGLINWALAPIPYFSNSWILSRERYLIYQAFLDKVNTIITNDREVLNNISPLMPMMWERLSCLFFYINKWIDV